MLAGGTASAHEALAQILLPAAAARAELGEAAASSRISGHLSSVTAISASDASAVGQTGSGRGADLLQALERQAWTRVPSPSPDGQHLTGVAATSGRNAWAVGDRPARKTVILHWNGTAWRRVPSPTPGRRRLFGVAATSARNAWAVGSGQHSSHNTLILHWNGKSWKRVSSPSPAGGAVIYSVAALSARNAWAVGSNGVLHWIAEVVEADAQHLPQRRRAGWRGLVGRNAWAVGSVGGLRTAVLRWNGRSWKSICPTPAAGGGLLGVAATSARAAWAVGYADTSTGRDKTLILRWNGTSWKRVPSPSPVSGSYLDGVAAMSASSAWAVGYAGNNTLIERWNGTSWKTS